MTEPQVVLYPIPSECYQCGLYKRLLFVCIVNDVKAEHCTKCTRDWWKGDLDLKIKQYFKGAES